MCCRLAICIHPSSNCKVLAYHLPCVCQRPCGATVPGYNFTPFHISSLPPMLMTSYFTPSCQLQLAAAHTLWQYGHHAA